MPPPSLIGPAQGIGRAIALRLAEDGFDVAVNDVSSKSENLDILVEEIQKKGRASSKHIADVSQDQEVQALVEEVVKNHGSLDVVSISHLLIDVLTTSRWLRMLEF
jgi:NAD(P)-dependent dehydrogenase (short-subunit alcohol dehydrogenase family)